MLHDIILSEGTELQPYNSFEGARIVIVQQHLGMLNRIKEYRNQLSKNLVGYTHRPIIALDAVNAYSVDVLVTGGIFYDKLSTPGKLPELHGREGIQETMRNYSQKKVGIGSGEELSEAVNEVSPDVIIVSYASFRPIGGKFDGYIPKNIKDFKELIEFIDSDSLTEIVAKEKTKEKRLERLAQSFPKIIRSV